MGRRKRNAAKEKHWRELIERQAESGLSVRAFCQKEDIREPSFYAWRRTIGSPANTAAEVDPQPTFVPAVWETSPAHDPSIVLEFSSGTTAWLPLSMPAEQVAHLVAALEKSGSR